MHVICCRWVSTRQELQPDTCHSGSGKPNCLHFLIPINAWAGSWILHAETKSEVSKGEGWWSRWLFWWGREEPAKSRHFSRQGDETTGDNSVAEITRIRASPLRDTKHWNSPPRVCDTRFLYIKNIPCDFINKLWRELVKTDLFSSLNWLCCKTQNASFPYLFYVSLAPWHQKHWMVKCGAFSSSGLCCCVLLLTINLKKVPWQQIT